MGPEQRTRALIRNARNRYADKSLSALERLKAKGDLSPADYAAVYQLIGEKRKAQKKS